MRSGLTGADVAASEDLTGAAAQGGDWNLEYQDRRDRDPAGSQRGRAVAPTTGILATYTVTNTNDSGAGSLRAAITSANASAGVADTIDFNIAGAGVKTIALASALPTIADAVIIDGASRPGFAGTPLIELHGGGTVAHGVQRGGWWSGFDHPRLRHQRLRGRRDRATRRQQPDCGELYRYERGRVGRRGDAECRRRDAYLHRLRQQYDRRDHCARSQHHRRERCRGERHRQRDLAARRRQHHRRQLHRSGCRRYDGHRKSQRRDRHQHGRDQQHRRRPQPR